MTKYVVLKSVVPSTFDGGFRSSGYEVIEFVETDEVVDVPKDMLTRILNRKATEYAMKIAARKK